MALAVVLGISGIVQAKQLAIVVDKTNGVRNLSVSELTKIFTTRTRSWPDGTPILIVLRDPSSSDMQLLLRKVLNMTPEEAREFIQAHRGLIVVAGSDDAVLQFVSRNRGAIGVVDLYSLTGAVQVIKIDRKLPVEAGYILRGN